LQSLAGGNISIAAPFLGAHRLMSTVKRRKPRK
jgi:hypothetical protein